MGSWQEFWHDENIASMIVSTTIAIKRSTHMRINVIKIGKGIGFAREKEEEGERGGGGIGANKRQVIHR